MIPGVSVSDGIKAAYTVVTTIFPTAQRMHKAGLYEDESFACVSALNDESIAFLALHEDAAALYVATRTPTIFHLRTAGLSRTVCGGSLTSWDMMREDFSVSVRSGFRPKPEVQPCPFCVHLFQEDK